MRYQRLKKWFCCLVFFCLGFKTVSYGLQPFAPDETCYSCICERENSDLSVLEVVASLVDMELDGKGKRVFHSKMDKHKPLRPFIQFGASVAATCPEYNYQPGVTEIQKPISFASRKFSEPAHHHFLFRLTPF